MQAKSLYAALAKPHVRAEVTRLKRAWMDNQTGKAWQVVANLAQSAESLDVRLKAARTILEAAGELKAVDRRPNGPPRQLVQIVTTTASIDAQGAVHVAGEASGVFELPAYSPTPAADEDDEA